MRRTRPLKILLVEDHPVNQKVAAQLLRSRGHAVEIASSGREALEVLADDGFDVILMDVQMPQLDGYATTRMIRERERATGGHIPIIALTACTMSGDRERCLAAGMDDYISKPIVFREVLEKIAAACRRSTPCDWTPAVCGWGALREYPPVELT
ncbi:MAG: response regulator [Acidobacteriia bacterium]|nr:response regulator [Terriglobia bacterium]